MECAKCGADMVKACDPVTHDCSTTIEWAWRMEWLNKRKMPPKDFWELSEIEWQKHLNYQAYNEKQKQDKNYEFKNKIQLFVDHYLTSYASDSIDTILTGAVNNRCLIIVNTKREVSDTLQKLGKHGIVDRKVIALEDLNKDSLRGYNKPILFDHFAVSELMFEALNEISRLEKQIQELT